MGKLKQLFASWSKHGLPLPHAYDPAIKQQSFRLLTAYISFLLACGSLVLLHVFPAFLMVPTAMAIAFFAINMIFYMLKKLTSAKIDLNDQEISLTGDNSVDTDSKP